MDPDSQYGLRGQSVPELLGHYAAILQELRRRGVVRTQKAPLGDYAECLAARVYDGELAPNSVTSYDLRAADGRRVRVKARTIHQETRGASFAPFRSFDFDVAVLIAVDSSTYNVLWAREVPAADIEAASQYSAHINGHRVSITAGARLGTDVTTQFSAVLSARPPRT
ncbi:hypothetical protein QRX50_22530 [Amycolatopsis carbonis]|uniref:DUF6998 domain-containing protein n=1 Tax=Amycolatopsis carbonis TaxID=715471 RepID=A0A9Y2N1S3_9PSEU|nr:hypothetical protein [Amycolatopsis sp. 2-15]WIX83334.1 hypothetical protein QRX50_22530 [Amycolatopsis sp. 2-15]